jgi:hypothetical protein
MNCFGNLRAMMPLAAFFLLSPFFVLPGHTADENPEYQAVAVLWRDGIIAGRVEIVRGELAEVQAQAKGASARGDAFRFRHPGEARLLVGISGSRTGPGSDPTVVRIASDRHPFSFLLRDVHSGYPMLVPEYGVVVTRADDLRNYREIESEIRSRQLKTKLQSIESEPEESYVRAAARTRQQVAPTWLGLGRDMRIFELSFSRNDVPQDAEIITPRNAAELLHLPESGDQPLHYLFTAGRGQSVAMNSRRWLEDGVLPILHRSLVDDDVHYHSVAFVTPEKPGMTQWASRGTDFLVADGHTAGHMFTEDQQATYHARLEAERQKDHETVLFVRTEAVNRGAVPRYAWFRTLRPGRGWWQKHPYSYDSASGVSAFSTGRAFGISRLNGLPMPQEEMAVLLLPGDTARFEFALLHQPVPVERALALSKSDFGARHRECHDFWANRNGTAAAIRVPEQRIQEMIQAGLLHLDLITYGAEPGGTLAPTIGVYAPIGTESAPIIQFCNSMGWHDEARRSLMYFIEKQHPDGLIQNFGGYMVETGAVLWSVGEYFRYTADTAWVREIAGKLLKSCDYLIEWRGRNKVPELKTRGYGLIDGKVADPEDPYRQYMLNAYACLGIERMAEVFSSIDPARAARLKTEADAWKLDIRDSFFSSVARAPLVPLGDGTWCPAMPPWPEADAPRALYLKPENFFSHGTFSVADALLGPLYLVFCGILEPAEPEALMMMRSHSELFYQHNTVFSQPYYSRHNAIQLRLGWTKPFLKTWYNTFSALADRETYTFWEHLYHASPHKTHEEAWFLMETRWMLYMEEGPVLHLLRGIPRDWMAGDARIELRQVASYFGPLDLQVTVSPAGDRAEARIRTTGNRDPEQVSIRLPHPAGLKPVRVSGGVWDDATETVVVQPFDREAVVVVQY